MNAIIMVINTTVAAVMYTAVCNKQGLESVSA